MIETQKNIKIDRADRLKRVRLMAGLSRREVCEGVLGLHPDTYKGWETARFGGLTERGAQKVVEKLSAHGVSVSLDWLLFGLGVQPFEDLSMCADVKLSLSDEDKQIVQERLLFQRQENAVEFELRDNAMLPSYQKGDVVAGIKLANFISALGQECIVQLDTGELTFRKLVSCSGKESFSLLPLHYDHSAMIDVQILMAAPVLWWRRKRLSDIHESYGL